MTGLIEQMTARYYQYAPGLKAFLLQSGCPPHLAEDIVQEAFYRALKHQLLPLRRIRNLRPWLYKVSYNLYIDSKRRQRELPTDQELTSPGKSESPEDTAVVREQGEVAKKALSRLPERQRTAIVLCLVSGLSYAEAAEVMSATEDGVRGLLHWGRMRLKQEYATLEGGGGDE